MKKALLAYSGGLDTSAILVWLREEMKFDVYCYCCDLGNQPAEDWLKERAKSFGAKDFIFEDMKEEFSHNYAMDVVRSGALYEGEYLLGTAIGRPLIAKRMSDWADKLNIDCLVHGATGKGNDQLRLEQSWSYLCPDKQILAPWKEWEFEGRSDLLHYLESKGYHYEGESKGKYSIDENLFHKSTEGAELEDIESDYDYNSILGKKDKNDERKFQIEFQHGFPIKINNNNVTTFEAFEILNKIGADNSIGIVDIVEERVNGIKSRGIYQTPGGKILSYTLKKLKEINWSHKLTKISNSMAIEYAELIYEGAWFSQAKQSLDSFFEQACQSLNGVIIIEISKSNLRVVSRKSEKSLYSKSLVSFEEDRFKINQSSKGFCLTRNLSYMNEGLVK